MKKAPFLLIIALVIGACTRHGHMHFNSADEMVERTMKQVKMMEPEELNDLMEAFEIYTLIDVRQELEHYYGFIPGTVNIPRGSLEFNIASPEFWDVTGLYEPQKDELIILYCQKGQRSILAAETLHRLGYTNVKVIKGGWKNWELSFPDIYEKDLNKLAGQSESAGSVGSC
jgi:rhodanese-related sulfurtransferase